MRGRETDWRTGENLPAGPESRIVSRMKTIKHIAWDWNGTLIDDVHAGLGSLNRMLERRGIKTLSRDGYRRQFDFPVKKFYEDLGFDFSVDDWHGVSVEFYADYMEIADDIPIRKGMLDSLAALRARGIGASVLSACEHGILAGMIESRGATQHFDSIYGIENLYADSKVDVGRRLMADHGLQPEELLVVGDTTHDHEVAAELGCRCLLFTGGHMTRERLDACGHGLLESLGDVETVLTSA